MKASSALKQIDNPEVFTQMPWYGKSELLLTFFIITLATLCRPTGALSVIRSLNRKNPPFQYFLCYPIFARLITVGKYYVTYTPKMASDPESISIRQGSSTQCTPYT